MLLIVVCSKHAAIFLWSGKGVSMFEKMQSDTGRCMAQVVNEFLEDCPTSFVSTDFDVQYLKISLALKNGHISNDEMVILCAGVSDVEKIWKKLNDVK